MRHFHHQANAEASKVLGKPRRHNIVPKPVNRPYVEYMRGNEAELPDVVLCGEWSGFAAPVKFAETYENSTKIMRDSDSVRLV